MKLRTYAIVVTLVLVAVLTNPSPGRHYEKLRQFYPWVNESLLAGALDDAWYLASPSERDALALSFERIRAPHERTAAPVSKRKEWLDEHRRNTRLAYESWGLLSLVIAGNPSSDVGLCATVGSTESLRPWPTLSIGLFGYVFAKGPPTPEEIESVYQRNQARDQRYSSWIEDLE